MVCLRRERAKGNGDGNVSGSSWIGLSAPDRPSKKSVMVPPEARSASDLKFAKPPSAGLPPAAPSRLGWEREKCVDRMLVRSDTSTGKRVSRSIQAVAKRRFFKATARSPGVIRCSTASLSAEICFLNAKHFTPLYRLDTGVALSPDPSDLRKIGNVVIDQVKTEIVTLGKQVGASLSLRSTEPRLSPSIQYTAIVEDFHRMIGGARLGYENLLRLRRRGRHRRSRPALAADLASGSYV